MIADDTKGNVEILNKEISNFDETQKAEILKKEMGSWKYPAFMFLYMGGLGYFGAILTFQFLK